MWLSSMTKPGSAAVGFVPLFLSILATLSIPASFSLNLPKAVDWSSHERGRELCLHKQGGQEGTFIKGFHLPQALVVTTPGLRFYYSEIDGDIPSPHDCHFKSFSQGHPSAKLRNYPNTLDYKLRQRSGNRDAVSNFKIFTPLPISSECQRDKMTPLGIAQSVWLGEYLSLAYRELWSAEKEMVVARTAKDEALFQSASALLYGFLHEKQFVKNHIYQMDMNYGVAENHNFSVVPQNIAADHSHYFIHTSFEGEHHLFKDRRSPTAKRDEINRLIGGDMSAKHFLASVALTHCSDRRTLDSRRERTDVDTAPQSLPYSLSPILSASDAHNEYLSRDPFFQSYAYSRTLPFRKFLQDWTQSSKSRHNPEVNLITVDDLFFLSLLTSVNITDMRHIPPVSRLVFEKFTFDTIHRQRMSRKLEPDAKPAKSGTNKISEDSFFRVLLNGKVVTQELGNCSKDPMASLGLCSRPHIISGLEGQGSFTSELRSEL